MRPRQYFMDESHRGVKDVGWTGDRSSWREVGRPLSGAGVGFSALDGLIRFDVARGLYPRKQTRISFYLGAPF